jgi:hypothetical protein
MVLSNSNETIVKRLELVVSSEYSKKYYKIISL